MHAKGNVVTWGHKGSTPHHFTNQQCKGKNICAAVYFPTDGPNFLRSPAAKCCAHPACLFFHLVPNAECTAEVTQSRLLHNTILQVNKHVECLDVTVREATIVHECQGCPYSLHNNFHFVDCKPAFDQELLKAHAPSSHAEAALHAGNGLRSHQAWAVCKFRMGLNYPQLIPARTRRDAHLEHLILKARAPFENNASPT